MGVSHKHISDGFYHLTSISFENGNIDGGGGGGGVREYNFSETILKENCLLVQLLQLPINFSHTRIEKHAYIVSLNIVIMATHLKFFSNLPFI